VNVVEVPVPKAAVVSVLDDGVVLTLGKLVSKKYNSIKNSASNPATALPVTLADPL
jgi:hypothetical protein